MKKKGIYCAILIVVIGIISILLYSRPIHIQKEVSVVYDTKEAKPVKIDLVIRRHLLGQTSVDGTLVFDGTVYYPYTIFSTENMMEEISYKLKEKTQILRFVSDNKDLTEGLKNQVFLYSEGKNYIRKFDGFTLMRNRNGENSSFVFEKNE